MKRTTEKINKMTGRELTYDGIEHTDVLSNYASNVMEYVNNVSDSDVFIKSRFFDKHIDDDPADIKVVSFSELTTDLICYALLYKGSLSPFFVSGMEE